LSNSIFNLKKNLKLLDNSWIRRRWLDFRFGHSVYLIFVLSFSNFILIFHRLLIERIEFFSLFSNLWLFTIVFVLLYIPISIGIGAWHRRTQIRVESEQNLLNNPFMARNFRVLIDIIEGTASKEEIKRFRNLLLDIEKKAGFK
jgi:hypothetical protein